MTVRIVADLDPKETNERELGLLMAGSGTIRQVFQNDVQSKNLTIINSCYFRFTWTPRRGNYHAYIWI